LTPKPIAIYSVSVYFFLNNINAINSPGPVNIYNNPEILIKISQNSFTGTLLKIEVTMPCNRTQYTA
jgi:hypothetical protein